MVEGCRVKAVLEEGLDSDAVIGIANSRSRTRSVAMASPAHSGWTSRKRWCAASIDRLLALSHGPPTQISRSVVGVTFVTASLYASTEAPSPGVPDAAPIRFLE